jgi:hypothetical protein
MCEKFYHTTCHPHFPEDNYLHNHYVRKSYLSVSLLCTVEHGYNIVQGNECFVLFQMIVVLTEEYNVIVNSEELVGTTEYLSPQTRYHINCYCYNPVWLCVCVCVCVQNDLKLSVHLMITI